jgi:hypothetical protein
MAKMVKMVATARMALTDAMARTVSTDKTAKMALTDAMARMAVMETPSVMAVSHLGLLTGHPAISTLTSPVG